MRDDGQNTNTLRQTKTPDIMNSLAANTTSNIKEKVDFECTQMVGRYRLLYV